MRSYEGLEFTDMWKHLHHECIVTLRENAWANKTSLTPPPFLKCLYLARKVSGRDLCVSDIDLVSFYDFSMRFWSCSVSVVSFVFLHLIHIYFILMQYISFNIFTITPGWFKYNFRRRQSKNFHHFEFNKLSIIELTMKQWDTFYPHLRWLFPKTSKK